MTASNLRARKIKSNVQLELTGSQINLSSRPLPATKFTSSSRYQSYPMRRAVSAFGFQPNDDKYTGLGCRPLSADNVSYTNNMNFSSEFSGSQVDISNSKEDFKNFLLTENEFENIVNGYSETKQICEAAPGMEVLKSSLSSKPPLPFNIDKRNATKTIEVTNRENKVKTLAEQEAFDEIIALKFKRWFPDPVTNHVSGGSSSDDDGANNLELLSYREEKFQTCEYRYEVTKKNKKKLPSDKVNTRNMFKNNRLKNKKTSPKINTKAFIRRDLTENSAVTVSDENMLHRYSGKHAETEKGRKSIDTVCNVRPIKINSNPEITFTNYDQANPLAAKNSSLEWLEEQDLRTLQEKRNSKTEKSCDTKTIECNANQKNINANEREPQIIKTSFWKNINRPSSGVNSYKKQKKISFLIDSQTDGNSKFRKEDTEQHIGSSKFPDNNNMDDSCDKNWSNMEDRSNGIREGTSEGNKSTQQFKSSQIDDVLSWMAAHRLTPPCDNASISKNDENSSMYEEIVDILKDIEQENVSCESNAAEATDTSPLPSPSAKAIWSLLEEAEKNTRIDTERQRPAKDTTSQSHTKKSPTPEEPKKRTRLSDLLRYSSTDLAQKVMTLQLLLEEKEVALQNLSSRFKKTDQQYHQEKQELEYSFNKQLRLIEQLRTEKKSALEKLDSSIKDMERKHTLALQTQEESHKILLKKSLEKQAALDKMERDKWIETKTQKIKEHAVKGLQPELERMALNYQEEISDIRKFHKKQLEELEEALNRRMAVQKEKMEADKEKALAVEREISRQRLNDEMAELEKKYQDQRKRLLAEVHVEQEKMERENDMTLAIREKENERKWEIKESEMQKRIETLQQQHQEEIQKLHQNLEAEKLIWIQKQTIEQKDKETHIKEQCRKERDKDIKLIIEKLENENREREQTYEQKIKRLKEQYDTDVKDLESANENLRRKLNENRSELQTCEETNSQLRTQLNQSNTEYLILKEKHDRLLTEQSKMQNMAENELSTQVHILQSQLKQAQLTYESEKKSLQSEKERELSRVYNKMKELFMEKDDLINSLKKQKDAALAQCSELEKFLDMKRKDPNTYG